MIEISQEVERGRDLWSHLVVQLKPDDVTTLVADIQELFDGKPHGVCLVALVQCVAFEMATINQRTLSKLLAALNQVVAETIVIGLAAEMGPPSGRA